MARVTVEDCLKYVENRFELVRLAAVRARQLDEGHMRKLEDTGEKNTLFALREIAAGKIDPSIVRTRMIDEADESHPDFQEGMRRLAEKEIKKRQEEAAAMKALEAAAPQSDEAKAEAQDDEAKAEAQDDEAKADTDGNPEETDPIQAGKPEAQDDEAKADDAVSEPQEDNNNKED